MYRLVLLTIWAGFLLIPNRSFGHERRLAFLVGNQYGWKGEPTLTYALSGDLRPLAKKLRKLGFTVKQFENQDAKSIRRAFRQITRFLAKNKQYKTFLFYYSGHSDAKSLHLGNDQKKSLTYSEFSAFFQRLRTTRKIAIFDSCYSGEVIRKFGSLTRYKKLLKSGKMKGIRARRDIDLHKLIVPKQGYEQGIRIIASSLDVSWELKQHRASVFTYHFLHGLKGSADLNHDGRITIDELFDYTSQRVLSETGQRPQQLLLLKRSRPYAIAPVYRSRLQIGSSIAGKLKVAVANFVWSKRKRKGQSLKLAVVDGSGVVSLEHKGRCFQQIVQLPKGGEAKLHDHWQEKPCKQIAMRRKGMLYLEAQTIQEEQRTPLQLALSGSFTQTQTQLIDAVNWGGGISLRWNRLFGIGLYGVTGSPPNKSFGFTTFWLRPEVGWTIPLAQTHLPLDIHLSLYAQLGFTIQHTDALQPSFPNQTIFVTGAGGSIDFSWWLTKHIGLRIGALGGFNYTPSLVAASFAFQWQVQSAILIGL